MNTKRIYIILAVFAISWLACAKAVAVVPVLKETCTYAIKGCDTLSLDKYECVFSPNVRLRPVVLFAFGGGFKGGSRDRSDYVPFFEFLAQQGYVVVSTDYRTVLKNTASGSSAAGIGFVAAMQQAIFTAVADYYDATRYVINHAEAWRVDTGRVIAVGSSAGAITVLQAEYELANRTDMARCLPDSFNYAGVVSFAGAICSIDMPVWKQKPCPMMLFHGDADRTVPYKQGVIPGAGGMWGSETIIRLLEEKSASFHFYRIKNAGHEVADIPMDRNKYDVLGFLKKQICLNDERMKVTEERTPGGTEVNKDFTVEDYLRSNSGE